MRYLVLVISLLISFESFAQTSSDSMLDDIKIYPVPTDIKLKISKKDFTENEVKILQSLESKRIEIERKSQILIIREKLIDLSELKLIDKITSLENLEESIGALLKGLSKEEEKRLQNLATVYAEMKPALAAERLNILDDITVYDILKRMTYKKSAKILEKMELEKVKVISRMLAEKTLLPLINR